MPRQGRLNVEGGIYHVIQRGLERKRIFVEESDCEEFIKRLSEGLKKTGNKCYGWALMPNHFHLILQSAQNPVGDLMRRLLTGYAIYFNRKYDRRGYLYQNRYKSILCQEEEYLLELVRYVHLNPLRGGLVKGMKELDVYRWSGHSVLMGRREAKWQEIEEVLGRFGKKKREAIRKYRMFIEEAKDTGKRDDLTGGGLVRSVGGWDILLGMRKSEDKWLGDERILGDGDFVGRVLKESEERMKKRASLLRSGWDIGKIIKKVCDMTGIEEKDIHRRSRGTKISEARSLVAYFSNKELGIKGVEIAKYFDITKASVSEAISRGEKISKENQYLIS